MLEIRARRGWRLIYSSSTERENKEFLTEFDKSFLALYPTFVNELNMEAWTEGRMMLTEEQMTNLRLQVDAFLEYIG